MIEFGVLTGKNIMSYGSGGFSLDLSAAKLSLIVGKNGASKSSIIEALTFCLFGKPYRKIKVGQLVNSINGKGLMTTIEFKPNGIDTYRIERGLKPSIFLIYKNGELISEEAAGRDYQKFLETQILGFTYKTFKQVVVIGSASYTQFMSLPSGDRRQMVEDLLDVTVFSKMASLVKDETTLVKRAIDQIETKILSSQGELKRLNSLLEDIRLSEESKKEEYQKQLADLEDKRLSIEKSIADYKNVIEELTKKVEGFDRASSSLAASKNVLRDNMNKVSDMKSTVKFFETTEHCSVCRQPITEEHKHEIISNEKSKIRDVVAASRDICNEIESIQSQVDKFSSFYEAMNTASSKLSSLMSSIGYVNQSIASIQKELARKNDSDKVITQISAVSNDIARLSESKITTLVEKDYIDVCSMMLKDTGIKSKIVATYVPMINDSINRYLETFDLFVNFELDENFNETIKSRHRDAFSYDSFSEGEKQRIDLSILFTWREIAKRKNSVACNLLFFDETLDSSLDSDSISSFLEMLRDQEDSNVFIISHRGADPVLFDRCIQAEKRSDGFSVIKEID